MGKLVLVQAKVQWKEKVFRTTYSFTTFLAKSIYDKYSMPSTEITTQMTEQCSRLQAKKACQNTRYSIGQQHKVYVGW